MKIIGILLCALALCSAAKAEEAPSARPLIERLVVSYAANGERNDPALAALTALDPVQGGQWTRIMDLWEAPVTVNDALPDDLPGDDTLCLEYKGPKARKRGNES